MKTLKLIIPAIVLIFSQSCRKGSVWGIYGKGSNVTRTYNLTGINAIDIDCDANVTYVQDSVYFVEVTAQQNIISVLDLKVIDGELNIGFLREVRTHNEITVKVHSPSMTSMTIDGSGNITVSGTLNTNNIAFNISGSGSITIPVLNSNNIDSKISGSGNIRLNAGTGKVSSYEISGAGNVYAVGMTCQSAMVRISGSGNVSVDATDTLNVIISGSGDVRYKGQPSIVKNITGSGNLIHIS